MNTNNKSTHTWESMEDPDCRAGQSQLGNFRSITISLLSLLWKQSSLSLFFLFFVTSFPHSSNLSIVRRNPRSLSEDYQGINQDLLCTSK